VLGTLAGLLFAPRQFFFPALMAYVLWGLLKTVFVGFMHALPTGDPLFDESDEDDADAIMRPVIVGESPGHARRKRRRRSRGDRQTPPVNRTFTEGE
jgi:CDP-diacylglycerol--serine O-phosphatidyltransferase